ncbi:MAG TPA: hypothetical protein GXX38_07805 [Clostridia bacterium]|nr:hypothetical protein [Clostridia bacterium]
MKGVIRLLLGIVLAVNLIVLSACGDVRSVTDIHVPAENSKKEAITERVELELETDSLSNIQKNSDEVLKILKMPVEDGRVLTLSVVGKKADGDIELYGVREVYVYEGENLLQSILIQEAINRDGVSGIEEGYSGCPSAEESAALKDVNFDGYMDLEVCAWTPNNSIPYYYWCWDNENQQFEYSFCLQLTGVDEGNKRLIASYKVENGLYYTDYYQVNEKNKLELIAREIEDVRPK